MTAYMIWFIVAMVAVFVEMTLMSFYLMAVALGAIAGGIAAYYGGSINSQIIYAAIVTIIASGLSFYLRKRLKQPSDKKLANLDEDQRVIVYEDEVKTDGTARVKYRGTYWKVYIEGGSVTAGIYSILQIDGTRLKLKERIGDVPQEEEKETTTEGETIYRSTPEANWDTEVSDKTKDAVNTIPDYVPGTKSDNEAENKDKPS